MTGKSLALLCITFISTSCSKPTLTKIDAVVEKPEGCSFDSFEDTTDVKRPFKVVCTVDGKRRRMDLMYRFAREWVCECGGDALVTFEKLPQTTGYVNFKILKYTGGAAAATGSEPKP